MAMTTIEGPRTGSTWEQALSNARSEVDEDLPASMRPFVHDRINRIDSDFVHAGDLTPDEIDDWIEDRLFMAYPSPLGGGQPGTLRGLYERVEVLSYEIRDLKAKVATLEETRS